MRINKIIIFFFIVVFAIVGVAVQIVQTEFFSRYMTKFIQKSLSVSSQYQGRIKKIEVNLFPPGLNIHGVRIKDQKKTFDVDVETVGVYFSLYDVLSRGVKVQEIYLSDGVLSFEKGVEPKKNKKLKLKDVNDLIRLIHRELPYKVSSLSVQDVSLKVDNYSYYLDDLKVVVRKDKIKLKGNVYDPTILRKIKYEDINFDSLSFDLESFDSYLKVNDVLLWNDVNKINVFGDILQKDRWEDLDFNLQYRADLFSKSVYKYIKKFDSIGKVETGEIEIKGWVKGKPVDYSANASVLIKNLRSSFINADSLNTRLKLNNDELIVESFNLSHGKGRIKSADSFPVLSIKNYNPSFVFKKARVSLVSFSMANALSEIKSVSDVLDASMTGSLEVDYSNNSLSFSLDNDFRLKDLELKVGKSSILKNDEVSLNNMNMALNLRNQKFDLNGVIASKRSLLNTSFSYLNGDMKIRTDESEIDLEEWGPFVGFDIKGVGKIDLTSSFNVKDTKLSTLLDLENFTFEGYKLSSVNGKVIFDIGSNKIIVNNTSVKHQDSQGFIEGAIDYGDEQIDLNLSHRNLSFNSFKEIYSPISSSFEDSLPNKIPGLFDVNASLNSGFNISSLGINGLVTSKSFYLLGENFENLKADFLFENMSFSIPKWSLKKGRGSLDGAYSYNLKNDNYQYSANINSIPVVEFNNFVSFPLSITGKLGGMLRGGFVNKKHKMKSVLRLSNTKNYSRKVKDSLMDLSLDDTELSFKAYLVEDYFRSEGFVDLSGKKKTRIGSSIDINNFSDFFSLSSVVDTSVISIRGSTSARADMDLYWGRTETLNFDFSVNDFSLNKGDFTVNCDLRNDKVLVEKGVIKKWNLGCDDENLQLSSVGIGNIGSDFSVKNKLNMNAQFFEIFNNVFKRATGSLKLSQRVRGNKNNLSNNLNIESKNISLKSDYVPASISRISSNLNFDGFRVLVNNIQGKVGEGDVSLNGVVDFSKVIPDINLKYKLNRGSFDLFKKSNIVITSNGRLWGDSVPYILSGNVNYEDGSITDEFDDMISGNSVEQKRYRYLPNDKVSSTQHFLNYNLKVKTIRPIAIQNSTANLSFIGQTTVSGFDLEPRLDGKMTLASIHSKAFFKNNEYKFVKGDIFFFDNSEISNPELNIEVVSQISDYLVQVKVLGRVDNFNLELTSEPPLPEQDILSLITFGYTQKTSEDLTESQRNAMTGVGLGSLLLDRFKINETLIKQFGVQLNLGTEINDNDINFLAGRGAVDSDARRVNTATKIELKKQLSKKVDMSVSSTINSGIGQTQTMKLNYNLNKDTAVESILEMRTTEEGEEASSNTSIGFDLKKKWTFK